MHIDIRDALTKIYIFWPRFIQLNTGRGFPICCCEHEHEHIQMCPRMSVLLVKKPTEENQWDDLPTTQTAICASLIPHFTLSI